MSREPIRSSKREQQKDHYRDEDKLILEIEIGKRAQSFLREIVESCASNNPTEIMKILRRIDKNMSQFTDALDAFQAEQATLLTNIATEIQQLADLVAAGNTNAADLAAGITALQAATVAAQDANQRLTADDSPVVAAGEPEA